MSKLRTFGIAAAMTAVAAVPIAGSGLAGAQDAGDCGTGGVAASASQENVGGLIGSLIPIELQVVAPINAPILSPSSETCTTNVNKVSVGGGGGGGGAAPSHAGGAAPAVAVGGAPRFAG